VRNLATGELSVGKFGWKAQAPSLHQFGGMALLLELGITNPEFPNEQPPLGNPGLLAACDPVPELEEEANGVQHLTDFMQLLAPVAPLPQSRDARAGDALFTRLGCDGCHVRRLRSGQSPIAALSLQDYAPYSDFLLHDMAESADGIRLWATVGLGAPIQASDPAAAVNPTRPGTVNVVAWVPQRLSDGALVNAVATITEAKTQAIRDLGLAATGTATDAVCVLCAPDGDPAAYGGPRSRWGEPLARAAYRAVLAGGRVNLAGPQSWSERSGA